jgi:hypothetical protein
MAASEKLGAIPTITVKDASEILQPNSFIEQRLKAAAG